MLKAEPRVGWEGWEGRTAPSLLAVCMRLHLRELGRKEGLEERVEGCRAKCTHHLEPQLFWALSFRVEQGVPRPRGEKVLEEGKEGVEGRGFPGLEADSGDGKVSSICPLLPGVLV